MENGPNDSPYVVLDSPKKKTSKKVTSKLTDMDKIVTVWAPLPHTIGIPTMTHLATVLNLFENFTVNLQKASNLPNASDRVRCGLAQQLISSFDSPISELGNLPLVKWAGLAPLHTHTGPHPATTTPNLSEELWLLKNSFDGALTTLAQEVKTLSTKVDKPSWAPTKPVSPPAKPVSPSKVLQPTSQPAKLVPPTPPSFASAVWSPARPSLVVSLAPPTDEELQLDTQVVKWTPLEVTEFLNTVLHGSPHQVTLSATRWTAKNNLVLTAGPDMTAHHLNMASHFITTSLSLFLSPSPTPVSISSCENVRWSRISINCIPTGASHTCVPYSPSECNDALAVDNPVYRSLHLTQLPSWVRSPNTYKPDSSSSLVLAFEDPDGEMLWRLQPKGPYMLLAQWGNSSSGSKNHVVQPIPEVPAPPEDHPHETMVFSSLNTLYLIHATFKRSLYPSHFTLSVRPHLPLL